MANAMFLIRSAFWLALVLLILPIDRDAAGITDGPGAFETMAAVQTAFQDLRGFCDRNPSACETGAETVDVLRQKAVYSAGVVQSWLDQPGEDGGPIIPASSEGVPESPVAGQTVAGDPHTADDPLATLIASARRDQL
ncbi:MAG: DUF5330 domain-containing protein [Devosiaceae bacterium]|nr:DUF5330 domain-containing protein [Devosiaceae bacterium MH13]